MKNAIHLAVALGTGLLLAGPAAAGNGTGARMAANILFQTADANKDGRLDAVELEAMRMQAFDRADANGDGMISKMEATAAEARRQRRADLARAMGAERFDSADANGDGVISRAEFQSAPRPGLALVDANSDGVIDRAELDRLLAALVAAR